MYSDLRKPDINRLIKTLRGEKTDVIPLIELGIHPIIKKEILGRPVNTVEDDIEFMRSLGYDFIKIQPSINFNVNQNVIETEDQGEYKNAPDRAWATEHEGVITNREEFEKFIWPETSATGYERFESAEGKLPDGMGVIGQYGDIFTLVWEMMGFETFAMAIYEDPELIEMLFGKVGNLVISMFENMADMDHVDVLWFSDDIAFASGLLVSPDFLRQYFFPWLKKIGDIAAKNNKPLIYHTDGLLWDVMQDIIDSGVTALHPIEPKAMEIKEVKEKYGDKLGLCGGIEVDTLCRGSKEETAALVKNIMQKAAPEGGWAAGSSNSVPDYASVENYLTMVEIILKEGSY